MMIATRDRELASANHDVKDLRPLRGARSASLTAAARLYVPLPMAANAAIDSRN